MARIAGVDLPKNKNIEIALTYIHGIGRSSSKNILKQLEIDPKRKSGQLDDQEVARIREVIDNTCKVEGDLRRELSMNIKRLMDLGTYRGLRHRKSLPLRGQRTSTNARTRKGPRRKMVGRKSKAS
ncbi:MAG: 30S ribosomal protein S13 [Deltaproteobacteria bacterium]|nr:30S ribosomal protein S13 [Deltaproteobacteria bacterium]